MHHPKLRFPPDVYVEGQSSFAKTRTRIGFILALSALEGCSPYSFGRDQMSLDLTAREGNPEIGTIHYFPQLHAPRIGELTPEGTCLVGTWQYEILKGLEAGGYTHVFAEGVDDRLPAGYTAVALGDTYGLVRQVFATRSENPTQEQVYLLAYLGAHGIYAALNNYVVLENADPLHRPISDKVSQDGDGVEGIERNKYLTLQVRERVAVQQIHDFLRGHPGHRVAFIFGAAHDFNDEFGAGEDTPRVEVMIVNQELILQRCGIEF